MTTIHLWQKSTGVNKHLYVTLDEFGHFEKIAYSGESTLPTFEITAREYRQIDAMQKAREEKAVEKSRKERHLDALRSIGFNGVLAALRSVEDKAHRLAEDYCNVELPEGEYQRREAEIVGSVAGLFGGNVPEGFFVNGDPRGYALKLDNDKVKIPEGMHTDWGGFGILAPEAGELR